MILGQLTQKPLPQPRQATLRTLFDSQGEAIDQALILFFPAPHSFTGEDVGEIHCHGSRAIILRLTEILCHYPNCRQALPGEFTRRAFDHGKMDLTAVEGLADLIDAETEAQRRQALRQMNGHLGALYQSWADKIKRSLAYIEAELDFPDEDLPGGLLEKLIPGLVELIAHISDHLSDHRRGERLRDGVVITILGAPNAGKSSLLNLLAQREVAIVSDRAGTTRDLLEVHLDLNGYPAILIDTAGIRESDDPVEQEGIRRALQRAQSSDLTLLLIDALAPKDISHNQNLNDCLVVINKTDDDKLIERANLQWPDAIKISARSGYGIDLLIDRLSHKVADLVQGENLVLTRARHRTALEAALFHLNGFSHTSDPALAAEELRMALRKIGEVTGRVDVEALLDVIFRDFCIGK